MIIKEGLFFAQGLLKVTPIRELFTVYFKALEKNSITSRGLDWPSLIEKLYFPCNFEVL